jgi:transposase
MIRRWPLLFLSVPITTALSCAGLRDARAIRARPDGFWLWRRSATAVSRSEAAAVGGVGLQTVRDWVLRFNQNGPDGLVDGKAPGQRPLLEDAQRESLRQVVVDGPIPAVHGVVRWRLVDLMAWVFEEFRVSISKQTMSRELRAMGFRKLSARPRHHAKSEAAAEAFKKSSRPAWTRSPRGRR